MSDCAWRGFPSRRRSSLLRLPYLRNGQAGSGLTDAGIKHLVSLTNLEWLNLRGIKASAAGVAELRKALPQCQIEWDGATGMK